MLPLHRDDADVGDIVVTSFFFVIRLILAWFLAFMLFVVVWMGLSNGHYHGQAWPFFLIALAMLMMVITGAFSHVRRVRLIAGRVDRDTLANWQRRQMEIPFEAGEAFDLLDAAIRELLRTETIESARDSLQIRAQVRRIDPYGNKPLKRFSLFDWFGRKDNQILATVTPGDGTGPMAAIGCMAWCIYRPAWRSSNVWEAPAANAISCCSPPSALMSAWIKRAMRRRLNGSRWRWGRAARSSACRWNSRLAWMIRTAQGHRSAATAGSDF